jgi:hypothetical protein
MYVPMQVMLPLTFKYRVVRKSFHTPSNVQSGTTALQPGLQKISVQLRLPKTDVTNEAVHETADGEPAAPLQWDSQTGLPQPSVYMPLVDAFHQNVGQFFPSIERQAVQTAIAE